MLVMLYNTPTESDYYFCSSISRVRISDPRYSIEKEEMSSCYSLQKDMDKTLSSRITAE